MVGMEVGVAALGGQQPSKDGFEWMGAHIIPGYQLLAYGEVLTRAYLVWTSLRLGFGSGTLVYAPIGATDVMWQTPCSFQVFSHTNYSL
ncbi:hypothetical protein ACLB2K_059072 [Fragaria x ananassa]